MHGLMMALSLIAAQQPAAGKLELSAIQPTVGYFGSPRTSREYLPGDTVHFTFEIAGLKPDMAGRLNYLTTMEITQFEGGKEVKSTKNLLGEVSAVNLLAAPRQRQAIQLALPPQQAKGEYHVKITIEDAIGKNQASFAEPFKFTVLERDFGLVQFQIYSVYTEAAHLPSPPVGVVGQTLYLGAAVSKPKGLGEDRRWAALVDLSVLDAEGKPVSTKPLVGNFKDIPSDLNYVEFRFDLPLAQAGKYSLQLRATEPVTKKVVTLVTPLQVHEVR